VSVAPPAGATWVILPTYDEAENVEAMLGAVLASLDGAGIQGRVLVVDDGSPDGTADLAEAVARREPRVAVLRRPD
jgi:dolichol-phosphate mannosyltransferase